MNVHLSMPPELNDPKQWVGVDIELFTQKGDLKHLHRPSTGRFASLQVAINEDVYVVTQEDQVAETLRRIDPATWVLHNGKFDFTHLRRWTDVPPRKRYWDTMTVEHILWGGYYTHFGLNHLVRRYLGEYMEKETRETFEGSNELDRGKIEYAAKDAYDTLRVARIQRQQMTEQDLHIWRTVDRPATWAFLDFRGFPIDVQAWSDLAIEHKRLQLEVDARLPLNPRSAPQVMKLLQDAGIKAKNTEAGTLEEILESGKVENPLIQSILQDILLSRMYGKRASTYGLKMIEQFVEQEDGIDVICTDYNIIGAETGRTSSSDPNMQNIPIRDTLVFRKCFRAGPDEMLIISDFSSQEPCLIAVQSGEPKLIDWIRAGKDIYIETTRDVFGKEITKNDPERKHMKSIILGGNYGMTEYGLARQLKITVDEAKEILKKFRKTLPKLAQYMDRLREERTVVYTPFGRKIWLNPYSEQCERNALNGPTQGGAGDQMKAGMGVLHQTWSEHSFTNFPLCAMVHDELVARVSKHTVQEDAAFIKYTMEKTATDMVNGVVPFRVDVHVGETWADKEKIDVTIA